jgi:hypothetical protein
VTKDEDQQLLELAAAAAGMSVLLPPWSQGAEGWFWCAHGNRGPGMYSTQRHDGWWNPLNDDGDALRLAAKVKMTVFVGRDFSSATAQATHHAPHFCSYGVDAYAATRRVITRAAATALLCAA